MWKRARLAAAAAIAFLIPITAAEAQRSRDDWRPDRTEWEPLGSAEIGTRLERDVIEVGRREGRFKSIGFTVNGNNVRIEDLVIVYAGGQRETLNVREALSNGTRSRPIDLPGRDQMIERIEITYRSPGPVKIDFYGEKIVEPKWVQLGCQRVGFFDSNDVIRVDRREGAFRAVKLQVTDATLRLDYFRVVFGDGTSQTFDVRSAIPPQTETRPLDLDGRRRTIDRIKLEYIPSLSIKRPATVCVLALEGGHFGDFRGRDWDERRDRGEHKRDR